MNPNPPDLRTLISTSLFIDAHAHCDGYPPGRREEFSRSIEDEKVLILSAGSDPSSTKKTFELADLCPWIIPCAGIHPWKAGEYGPDDADALEDCFRRAVMINETGLDREWAPPEATLEKQRRLFEAQLAAAVRLNKPLTLHTKGAEQEVLDLLIRYDPPAVLIHWYDGPPHILSSLLDRGCLFTAPPAVLNAPACREMIRRIPAGRLLAETDNPTAWPWLFGAEGTPCQIREVYRAVASLRGISLPELHALFRKNLTEFLGL